MDNSTISSLSSHSDVRKTNLERNLKRNKQVVAALSSDNKKNQKKFTVLNKKINKLSKDFIEKKGHQIIYWLKVGQMPRKLWQRQKQYLMKVKD